MHKFTAAICRWFNDHAWTHALLFPIALLDFWFSTRYPCWDFHSECSSDGTQSPPCTLSHLQRREKYHWPMRTSMSFPQDSCNKFQNQSIGSKKTNPFNTKDEIMLMQIAACYPSVTQNSILKPIQMCWDQVQLSCSVHLTSSLVHFCATLPRSPATCANTNLPSLSAFGIVTS